MLGSRGRAACRPACLCLLLSVSCGTTSTSTATAPVSPAASDERALADDSEGKSPFETCYSTFSPSGDPTADLSRLVRSCGPMGGMRAVTGVHQGSQDE